MDVLVEFEPGHVPGLAFLSMENELPAIPGRKDAACGGHTGDPRELFGGEGTGAAAVMDPGCPSATWSAAIPAATFARVARDRLGSEGGAETFAVADLDLRYGTGGYLVQVAHGSRRIGGEAFARALDGAMGYGVVRSSRFRTKEEGSTVLLSGDGIGHGVGLCQAGAMRHAARGHGYQEILRHYFARATIDKLAQREEMAPE